jgi:hypothetical protein
VTFTCNATPSASSYQWSIDGHLVDQATGATYTTGVASVSQLQSVTVTGNTSSGCVINTSASASAQYIPFSVNPPLIPTVSIVYPTPVVLGSAATFTASPVNGGSNPAYQWQLNGQNVPGATGSTFTNNFTTGSHYQTIGVVMNSSAMCVVNAAAASNTIELASPMWENRNYVVVHSILKPGIDDWVQTQLLPIGDKLQTTTYFDGIGRAIQDVAREVSLTGINTWGDLVKHYDYSDLNAYKSFIPYSTTTSIGKFKTTASDDQKSYIQNFYSEPSSAPTYAQTIYDASPLERVLKMMTAGISWGGSGVGVSNSYDFNTVSNGIVDGDNVHIWNIDYSANAIPLTSPSSVYPTGTLTKTTSFDEKNNRIITYTDMDGNMILKKVENHASNILLEEHSGWLCTYYVYDDLGDLRYIITPKAVEWLDNNGWAMSQTIVDALCYKYVYDERGRLIIKKQPEAGEQYLVYDKKNRPVLVQTANQRKVNNSSLANDQWSFSLYDEQGREVVSGLVENNASRSTIQGYVNTLNNNTVTISAFVGNGSYQSIDVDNPVAGSTSSSNYVAGNSNITFNTITLYDNYNYNAVKSFNTSYSFYNNNDPSAQPTIKTNRTINFVTGEKKRLLDNDNNPLNDQFINSTVYYDEHGNVLQVLTDNHKNGVDYQTNQYDFSGKLLSRYTSHYISGGTTYTVTSRNVYDRIGRLKELYKSYNGSLFKQLADYNYDELGNLKLKRIGPTSPTSQMESQNYSYNINGMLTGINKAYALSNDNYSQWGTYFSEYLGHDNSDNLFAASQHNGNITGIIWRTQGDNTPRKYDYTYDQVGRLASAAFTQKDKPSLNTWSSSKVDFSVYMQYEDGNGNIKSMKQMGIVPGNAGIVTMDDLRYTYNGIAGVTGLEGNQLKQVDDLGNMGSYNGRLGDFNNSNSGQDYWYDQQGNLVKD